MSEAPDGPTQGPLLRHGVNKGGEDEATTWCGGLAGRQRAGEPSLEGA